MFCHCTDFDRKEATVNFQKSRNLGTGVAYREYIISINNSQKLLACKMAYNSVASYLHSIISDMNFVMNLCNNKLD